MDTKQVTTFKFINQDGHFRSDFDIFTFEALTSFHSGHLFLVYLSQTNPRTSSAFLTDYNHYFQILKPSPALFEILFDSIVPTFGT
jgi:hypothetical protein